MVNGQDIELFGYEREALIGAQVEMLVPECFRERHLLHRIAYGSSPALRPMGFGLKLVGLRKDGSEFPLEISLSPVQSPEHPEQTYVIAVIRDVSDRERLEDERNALASTNRNGPPRRRHAGPLCKRPRAGVSSGRDCSGSRRDCRFHREGDNPAARRCQEHSQLHL